MVDPLGRERSAYCFLPGIWFGSQDTLAWDRVEDVVAERTIVGVAQVKVWRQGIVWFDFSGMPLEKPERLPLSAVEIPSEGYLRMLARRALYMTAHSTCIMKALEERTNNVWVAGTLVTTSKQIVAGGKDAPPTSSDLQLRNYCIDRWIKEQPVAFWESIERSDVFVARLPLSETDATRSLELLDSLALRPELLVPLALAVRAQASLQDHDFTESLVASWTMIEMALGDMWERQVSDKIEGSGADRRQRIDRLQDTRSYTASVRTEILHLTGLIDSDMYGRITKVRTARNDFLHRQKPASAGLAILGVRTCGDILRIAFDYRTPISPGLVVYG